MAFDLSAQLVASMSWVEDPFRAFWTLALESNFYNATTRFFTPKIDDHGIRRGDTGRILARWRRPVASHEALDVLHREMHAVSHRRIRMAIEMPSKVGEFFFVVDFL